MTADIKPYPAYKDSGVPWLGQVPDNWTVQRLSASITDFVAGTWGSEPNGRDDTICVRVADFDRSRLRVRVDRPTIRAIAPADLRRKRLTRGHLLLEKSGGGDLQPVGVVMLFDHEEVAVCSNFVARMSVTTGFEPEFLTYLHTTLYSIGLNVRSIKQTTGIQNLDCRAYLSESVAFPPLSEQVSIVRYLDHADRKMRHAIRARQQLIKLLTEQKQATIQRAVTRGLDPNVRLKPSGVPWLGDVPEHWEIRKVKYVLQTDGYRAGPFGSALITSQLNPSGTIEVLSPEHVARASMNLDIDLFLPETREREMSQFLVKGRDILFPIVGTLGRAMVVPRDVGKAIINQRLARLRPDETRINSDYLVLLMSKVTLYQELDRVECKGSILDHITKERILERPLPLPPLGEQRAILQFVNAATASLDKAIYAARREIDLLREYRTRLIADVVTGKLDVRGVKVPDDETDVLPEDVETIDDVDTVDQTDDVTEGNSESNAEETA